MIKNKAAKPNGPNGISGGAGAWKQRVIEAPNLGPRRVNSSPAVGAVAWWSSGHVAYVEKVVKGAVYISDSNWGTGSKRYITTRGGKGWPDKFLHIKDAPGGSTGDDPHGHLDKAGSPSAGKVRVAGWAFDPNKKKSPVGIHVYVGGKAGAEGARGYNIGKAAKRRADVAKAHKGVGSTHGFDATFKTSKRGKAKVCVYAIDIGPGSNKLLGCKTVGIKAKVGENDVKGTYTPPLVGDYNGDGYTDILWYQPGRGGGTMWFGTPTKGVFDKGYRNDVKGTYTPPLVGDFNGDGYADIFFYKPGPGGDSIWYGTKVKGEFSKGSTAGDVQGTYTPPLPGDYNGDGYTDIHWYQPGTGGGTMWFGTSTQGVFDKGYRNDVKGTYKPPLPGDYNGDGYTDIFFYQPGPGGDSIWYGTASKGKFLSGYSGGDVKGTYTPPLVGDYNGDGYTDILWYQPGRGGGTMWFGTPTKGVFDKGYRNDVKGTYTPPLVGDFNGDGYADIFFYKPGPGGDSIWYGTKVKGEFSK